MLAAALLLSALAAAASAAVPPLPTAPLLEWTQREIGAMISFDMITELTNVTNSQHFCIDVGGDRGFALPPATNYAPALLSTDSWLDAAVAMGAKYSVLVAMHCSGFAQWATDVSSANGTGGFNYTYSTKYSGGAAVDVVESYMASSKSHGVLPGFYYSLNETYYLNVGSGRVQPASTLTPGQANVSQETYIAIAVAQQIELWKKYEGQLSECWFDGGDDLPGVNEALAAYQPQAVFFGGSMPYNNLRWVGTESGTPGYPVWSNDNPGGYGQGNPDGSVFMPAESDTTLSTGDSWFWKPNYSYRTLADLQDVYHATVGANSNMLLNIAPNADGVVPPEAMALYTAFGSWVKACYSAPGAVSAPPPGAVIELDLSALASVDRLVAMEDQGGGEQVRAYSLEVQGADGAWLPAETGQAVGHKRIHRLAAPVAKPSRARLNVTATIGGVDPAAVKWVQFAAIDGAAAQCL